MKSPFTVSRMLDLLRDTLQLDVVTTGEAGFERVITTNEVSSPGLVLAGFVERFAARRMQVFGETEMTYLASLPEEKQNHVLELFFSFDVPCAVVTKGIRVPAGMIDIADRHGICVLSSPLKTTEFYRRVKPALDEEFAPTTTLHGSLADVYGVGLLFVGKSGIGKSECVLDLV
ncbi:MAG TPA: hypothetical protein VFT57_17525, partial [Gemmatimonadaceae bacterium]|nr:hypothetical protein [Gemmatimonadaceae bacterium]